MGGFAAAGTLNVYGLGCGWGMTHDPGYEPQDEHFVGFIAVLFGAFGGGDGFEDKVEFAFGGHGLGMSMDSNGASEYSGLGTM